MSHLFSEQCLFTFNNSNARRKCEICSKSTIKNQNTSMTLTTADEKIIDTDNYWFVKNVFNVYHKALHLGCCNVQDLLLTLLQVKIKIWVKHMVTFMRQTRVFFPELKPVKSFNKNFFWTCSTQESYIFAIMALSRYQRQLLFYQE